MVCYTFFTFCYLRYICACLLVTRITLRFRD
uniref:Uncharacterized protein n=1 Tax=Lepeophtheirus salmonis TaxID=72036 RepID=A0A0K2T0N3_LEPSM